MNEYIHSEEAMVHKDNYERRSSIYDLVKLALFSLVAIGIGVIIFFLVDQQQRVSHQTAEILDCATTTGKCYQERSFKTAVDVQATLLVAANYCQGLGLTTYPELERCTLDTFSREYQGAK